MEVAKVFAISPVFSSEGGTSRGVPCVNCGHTRREEPPLYPLPDRVEGVIVDVGWALGPRQRERLLSPRRVATVAKDA
jgi:hypothetical protein